MIESARTLRVAIDARCLTTPPTGIGHYLLAAVNVCAELAPDVQWVLMAHRSIHPQAQALLADASNISWVQSDFSPYERNGLLWLLFGFARMAKTAGATHIWGACGLLPPWGLGRLIPILTVHDLVFKAMPWTMSLRNRLAYGLLTGGSIRQAKYLWSVSTYTRQEVDRCYRRPKDQVRVVGSGLNPRRVRPADELATDVDAVLLKHRVTSRTLIFVGTLEPRKNLEHLIRLMPHLKQDDFSLLVVGCKGWGKQTFSGLMGEPGYPVDRVHFADYVPDRELQVLYSSVFALVCPSLLEGFGLPLLEAMEAGCPVVAADNSALPEVVGEGGLLVKGWDVEAWVRALRGVAASHAEFVLAAQRAAAKHQMANPCAELLEQIRHPHGLCAR